MNNETKMELQIMSPDSGIRYRLGVKEIKCRLALNGVRFKKIVFKRHYFCDLIF
jgi:hypothetical protein